MIDLCRRVGRGPLRALLATTLVAALAACATPHVPTPPLPEPAAEPVPEPEWPQPVARPETAEPLPVAEPQAEPPPAPAPPPAPPTPPGPCVGTIELPALQFALGQAVIRLDSFDILDRAIARLAECPDKHVRLEGYSDSTGSDELNQRLSRQRAEVVLTYLVEAGIDAKRVTAEGFGGERPVATNDTAAGRAQNRRVEIHFDDVPQE